MNELALRSQLNNLEALRSSLHSSLRFWEWMVVVGLVIDLVVIVKEYWDELADFKRGEIHPPERPSTLLLLLGLLGTGLIAVGIARELAIDSRIEGVETETRQVNGQLFGIVSHEAQEAAEASSSAKIDAGLAKHEADAAEKKLEVVAKRAEGIDNDLRMTQMLTSARRVDDVNGLTQQFRQFKGQTVALRSTSDSEPYGLCFVLKSIAHDAEMNPIDQCGLAIFAGAAPTGILVAGPDDNIVQSMARMVSRIGKLMVQSGPFGNTQKPSTLVIVVGPKPPFEIGQARGTKTPVKKQTHRQTTKP